MENMRFTDQDVKRMIYPLFVERMLAMLVGLADTFVISFAGEAAVSGVSLVNQLNNVYIFISTAIGAGGAVVTSQYIGRGSREKACESASQLVTLSVVIALAMMAFVMLFRMPVLRFLFGQVEPEVMEACVVYLNITAFSYPMIAVYDAGAAAYRSMGNTKVTMEVSIIANLINTVGNLIGVFVLKAGVAGVAWPSVLARGFSAAAITCLCFRRSNQIFYRAGDMARWDGGMVRRLLKIVVPNGVENGLIQLVKVAMSSMVSLFGTCHIAANGIAQIFWTLSGAFGNVGGAVMTTVIGQCMGEGDIPAAEYYLKRLTRMLRKMGFYWNVVVAALMPLILHFYALSDETRRLIVILVLMHNVFSFWLYPFWGSMSAGLRAAGDVRFMMYITVICTIFVRLAFAWVFGVRLGLGVVGICMAMVSEWFVHAAVVYGRFRSGRWKCFKVI